MTPVPDPHTELPDDPDRGGRAAHRQPTLLLLVVAGGAAGTLLREWVSGLLPVGPTDWPVATFVVNLAGCLVLGALLEELAGRGADAGHRRRIRLLVGTGFCGGLTTYSTFAVEIDLLIREHAALTALIYAAVTVVAGVTAAALGVAAASGARRLARR